ncbi:hypothetical protein AAVH_28473 [Aphelenchoides avenae]|nr:hypothetical protein AAVH_28473 [Aphelenchus avenae]
MYFFVPACAFFLTVNYAVARSLMFPLPGKYAENLRDAPRQPLVLSVRPRLPVDRQELVSMLMRPGGEQLLTFVHQGSRLSKRQMEQWLLLDPKSAYARFG